MKHASFILTAMLLLSSLLGQTQDNAIQALHVKKFVAPVYPATARKARIMGRTTTELQIRADGKVDSAKILTAYPLFADPVETALKRWVFEPIPKPATLQVNVQFSLGGCDEPGFPSSGETVVLADLPENVDVKSCVEPAVTNVN